MLLYSTCIFYKSVWVMPAAVYLGKGGVVLETLIHSPADVLVEEVEKVLLSQYTGLKVIEVGYLG